MDAILLGIDGTGALLDRPYHADMHNSFVSYIVRKTPARVKRYTRGPYADGFDMATIVADGYQFVHLNLVAHPDAPIFLTGYSRGGAGVISVARRLAEDKVKIRAIVLFDAVDRAIGIDGADIPNNVEHVVYARRHADARSRYSFGNCGTQWHAPTRCEMKYFLGTHGALGGVPWIPPPGSSSDGFIEEPWEIGITHITYAQDLQAARDVWIWVKPRLAKLGYFGAQISSSNGEAVA